MRTYLIVLGVVALASCKAVSSRDCSTDGKQILECVRKHTGNADREMLIACLPFSNARRIVGTWVYGFEHNAFYVGQRASPRFLQYVESETGLDVENSVPNDGRLRVFQVEMIGRQSLCDVGVPKHVIVADRILSQSLVARSD